MRFKPTLIQSTATKLFTSDAKEFLLLGGSRSGKTFIIVRTLVLLAIRYPGSRHLIARFRFNHVKNSVWNDTLKKVIDICFPNMEVKWNSTDYFISIEQEGMKSSEIWIAGLDDKERIEKILGMEFMSVHLNEASQISYNAYNIIKTRLAQKVTAVINGVEREGKRRLFIDQNPPSKKHWTFRLFHEGIEPEEGRQVDRSRYAFLKMNPDQNLENIGSDYMEILNSMPESKRKRFKDGDYADDSADALWTTKSIAETRVSSLPSMRRIVVAIDPSTTANDGSNGEAESDEAGIIAAGLGYDDHLYIFEDRTGILKPIEWAREAIDLYNTAEADAIVGEVNQGGDMVETIVKSVNRLVNFKSVRASRDKKTRAEPVASLWDQKKAHIVGDLPELELEMTTWAGRKGEKSPNRIDALVWAAAELLPIMNTPVRKAPRMTFNSSG